MARDTLTGSRIRERRIARGVKQAELARAAGISASYLNLIEHNRRKIGGKLLLDIAEVLRVDATLLADGAGAALIEALREAASDFPDAGAELERADEFAGRFVGWAQVLTASKARISMLERTIETLTDRLTHDPHLAASLHDMLSTVTAIRSAASILAEPGEIPPEWQARFHRNIFEDSARLADASRGLVSYLDADEAEKTNVGTPQEEVQVLLEQRDHRAPELEVPDADVAAVLQDWGAALTPPAHEILRQWLQQYFDDARALPIGRLADAIGAQGVDTAALCQGLGAAPPIVMRRLAAMPPDVLPEPVGLAICDASGVLRFRKALPDFPMPRFGAACPLWPLYAALNRPLVLISQPLGQQERPEMQFRADAIATPVGAAPVNREPLYQAHMLIRPVVAAPEPVSAPEAVGVACRICAKPDCRGRQEPSILTSAT